jgi:hypothetical protein
MNPAGPSPSGLRLSMERLSIEVDRASWMVTMIRSGRLAGEAAATLYHEVLSDTEDEDDGIEFGFRWQEEF